MEANERRTMALEEAAKGMVAAVLTAGGKLPVSERVVEAASALSNWRFWYSTEEDGTKMLRVTPTTQDPESAIMAEYLNVIGEVRQAGDGRS